MTKQVIKVVAMQDLVTRGVLAGRDLIRKGETVCEINDDPKAGVPVPQQAAWWAQVQKTVLDVKSLMEATYGTGCVSFTNTNQ